MTYTHPQREKTSQRRKFPSRNQSLPIGASWHNPCTSAGKPLRRGGETPTTQQRQPRKVFDGLSPLSDWCALFRDSRSARRLVSLLHLFLRLGRVRHSRLDLSGRQRRGPPRLAV